jgi:peptidoglycan/LPS O-acetylase OafA/YrhL
LNGELRLNILALKMKNSYVNLDFVRTVAVFCVVLRHVLGALNIEYLFHMRVQLLGIFGVMLFFVLTSLVLMFSLERLHMASWKITAAQFYIQRIFRIYPLSMAVVAVGFLSLYHEAVPGFLPLNVYELLQNLFLVQNITGAPSVIGPLWSLPLEVQMYVFLPVMYFALGERGKRISIVYLLSVFVGVAAFKLPIPDTFRFFPCFAPGVLAYVLMRKVNARPVLPFFVLPLVLLLGCLTYELLGIKSQTAGAYPVCLLVGVLIPFVRESTSLQLNAISGFFAKHSYGIYLVHAPCLAFVFSLQIVLAAKIALFFIMTVFFARLAYVCIEAPMTSLGKRVSAFRPR